jgi:molybdopterin molybdotransferase
MTPYLSAKQIVLEACPPFDPLRLPLESIAGMRLAEDVLAPFDLPAFDSSAVDGYGVGDMNLAAYELVGEIKAGDDARTITVQPTEAVRLFTGSEIPDGVRAVAMQEDVRREGAHIVVSEPLRVGQNIRPRGAEIQQGSLLMAKGSHLSPPALSLLATVGLAEGFVNRRPVVSLVGTGNELRSPGETLARGQIYESISYGLSRAVEATGATVRTKETAKDDLESVEAAFSRAFESDVVISYGGISVGDYDLVRKCHDMSRVRELVWGVRIRPGKPFYFGIGPNGQKVFGLPGNPVSALVTFWLFVRPALLQMVGRSAEPIANLPLGVSMDAIGNRDDFVRMRFSDGVLLPSEAQGSHMLSGLAEASHLVRLPAGSGPYSEGDLVEALPLAW